MTRLLRLARNESGLTLIETMASLLVFAIVTLGVAPLLAGALRGAAMSRSFTIGKNAVLQSMERIRGLPFYISYGTQNTKVDVLDLYFPCGQGPSGSVPCTAPGGSYSNGTYVTTCEVGSTNPACPRDLPENMRITFLVTFVKPAVATATEDYVTVLPATDYRWDSTAGKDTPASQLLDIRVVGQWGTGTRTRDFQLQSLVGDRELGDVKLYGLGKLSYGVQILTGFNPGGSKTELSLLGGMSESSIETRLTSEANQSVRSGQVRLARVPTDSNPSASGDVASVEGAVSIHRAPPDSTPAGATVGTQSLNHTEITPAMEVARLADALTRNIAVRVANELPHAQGEFVFATPESGVNLWAMNQAVGGSSSPLKLNANLPMVHVYSKSATPMQGGSSATTGALGAVDKRVETSANVSFRDLRILPTTFIQGPLFERAVVLIDEFSANVTCKATGIAATSLASGTYSAKVYYWKEDNPNDGQTKGGYALLNVSGNGGIDPLATVKATNPMVYEDPSGSVLEGSANDAYLFPVTHTHPTGTHEHPGYLSDWSSMRSPTTTMSSDGKSVAVDIGGAIRVDTTPTNPAQPESQFNVSAGKLGCQAIDNR